MNKITDISLGDRLNLSAFAGFSSGILIGITQIKESIEQILLSSGVETLQVMCTSLINMSIYNYLKKFLSQKSELEIKNIIYISILLVSILGVGAPKYIIHKLAGTTNPEIISFLYTVGNIIFIYLYEYNILQKKK